MIDTISQYDSIIAKAREKFIKKKHDYGDSWRLLRLSSITDKIFVKAKRIRQIEEADGKHEISDDIETEYFDILNYSVLALIKIDEERTSSLQKIDSKKAQSYPEKKN